MKIIKKNKSINIFKPEGVNIRYYLRDEYELHYNEQKPGTTQTWHSHKKILETLYIIEGELVAKWKEKDKLKKQLVKAGDLIETEKSFHTFINCTDKTVKFITIKQMLAGKNKRKIFKSDKITHK